MPSLRPVVDIVTVPPALDSRVGDTYCRASTLLVMLMVNAWISVQVFGIVLAYLSSLMSMNLPSVELLKKLSGF